MEGRDLIYTYTHTHTHTMTELQSMKKKVARFEINMYILSHTECKIYVLKCMGF